MTEYEPDTGLNAAVKTVLTERKYAEFKPLTDQGISVLPFLKVTTNSEGDHTPCKGCPVKIQKVSDLHRAAGIDADYILLVDYYAWNHPKGVSPVLTQEAMLHHALKMIKIEVKDGKVKKGKNEPEISQFADTVHRYPSVMEDYQEVLAPALGYSARIAKEVLADAGEASQIADAVETVETVEEETPPPVTRRGGRK